MISKQVSQVLAKKIEVYLAARKDKKHEDYLKSKPQTKKGITSKGINTRLIIIAKRLVNDDEAVRLIEKSKKGKEQTPLSFQLQKYQDLLSLVDDAMDNELSELKTEYQQFLNDLEQQHQVVNWLDEWAEKAKDISFATHVAKLTQALKVRVYWITQRV